MRGTIARLPWSSPLSILTTALEAHHAGIRVIPIRADGSKAPYIKGWPDHQTTEAHIHDWFDGPNTFDGIGAVCGDPSGGLLMLEIEGAYVQQVGEVRQLAEDSGLADLWAKMANGWMEQSPSGGLHWFIRVDGPAPRSTRLAWSTDGKVIAETRGNRGYTVLAPSHSGVHATGRPWIRITGGPATTPLVSADDAEALMACFSTLDESPPAPEAPQANWTHSASGDGARVGDDFNQRADWMLDVLDGWKIVSRNGPRTLVLRPGDTDSKQSGNIMDIEGKGSLLYLHSTSTILPAEQGMQKFTAYTLLHHGGDYTAAAKQLRSEGYGKTGTPFSGGGEDSDITIIGNNPISLDAHRHKKTQTDPKPELAVVPNYGMNFTDDANSIWLIDHHGPRLRYRADTSQWLAWDDTRWEHQPENHGRAYEYAKDAMRRLPTEGPEDRKKYEAHKKASLSARGINAALRLASTDPRVMVDADQLDAHPWELNTPDGIVDLRTGHTSSHDPDRMHTKITAASPDPDADQTPWLELLEIVLPDEQVRCWFHRAVGYSLIGETREHLLIFLYGEGGNGKGTTLETLQALLGDYAAKQPAGFLMSKQNQDHPAEIAKLQGKRFVITSEVAEKDRMNDQRVKEITGGDRLAARHLYGQWFEFDPSHTLFLMANHKPALDSVDKAMIRRMRMVPFTAEIPEHKREEGLKTRLIHDHGPAVLAWAIQGAVEYAQHGLGPTPEAIMAATEEYIEENDHIGIFLEEEAYYGPSYDGQGTRTSEINQRYETWCKENNYYPLQARRFRDNLKRHGIQVGDEAPRNKKGKMYGRILLRPRGDDWITG